MIGLKGTPDIIGFLRNGKFIGIECKTGNATQNNSQKSFERVLTSFGGIYILARDSVSVSAKIDELLSA